MYKMHKALLLAMATLCFALVACNKTEVQKTNDELTKEEKEESERLLALLGDSNGVVLHTDRAVGDTLTLGIVYTTEEAVNAGSVSGIEPSSYPARYPGKAYKCYTITSQDIVLKGDIKGIDCERADISTLVVDKAKDLKYLYGYKNNPSFADLSKVDKLKILSLSGNERLSKVRLTSSIDTLYLAVNPALKGLNLSETKNLKFLSLYQSAIENIDLSQCKELGLLNLSKTPCPVPDMKHLSKLSDISLEDKGLTSFDQTLLPKTSTPLWVSLKGNNLTSLDVSNTSIRSLVCGENPLSELRVNDGMKELYCHKTKLSNPDFSNADLLVLNISGNNDIQSLKLKSLPFNFYLQQTKLASLEILNNENLLDDIGHFNFWMMQMVRSDVSKAVVSKIIDKLPRWKDKSAVELYQNIRG